MKKRRQFAPDKPLGEPKKRFDETFSAEQAILDWLEKEGATESVQFDEDTGRPYRAFTIKLNK